MAFANGQGIKKTNKDLPSIAIQPEGAYSGKFFNFTNYKALSDIFILKGQITANVANAVTEDKELTINYKDDHFFNFLKGFELKADSDIFKNLQSNIAYFRYYQALCSLGNEYPALIPQKVTIPDGATSASVPFELCFKVPYIMEDVQNPQQTGLLTWLFNNIVVSFITTNTNKVIESITDGETTATASIVNTSLRSVANYQIVDNNYLTQNSAGAPLDREGVLQKIGGLFRTEEQSQVFTAQGTSQLIKLNSFGTKLFKDMFLVFREANTGNRVEGIIDDITFTNGDSPLINEISLDILRLQTIDRYKLLAKNFAPVDDETADGTGELFGVYHITADYFGNLGNAALATSGWQQPQLLLNINEKINQLSGGLKVEIFTSFNEVTQSVGRLATGLATRASTPTQIG